MLLAIDSFDTFLLKQWTCQRSSQCCTRTEQMLALNGYSAFNMAMMNETFNQELVMNPNFQIEALYGVALLDESHRPPSVCAQPFQLTFQGMIRDWIVLCFIGSLATFFGALWLCRELLILAGALEFAVLPWYTVSTLYNRYNDGGTVFDTWWYAAVLLFQFAVGFCIVFLYAYTKMDIDAREREECMKADMGMLKFEDTAPSKIVARPCGCILTGSAMNEVIKRYNQPHDLDVRSNILCPTCKERVLLLCE